MPEDGASDEGDGVTVRVQAPEPTSDVQRERSASQPERDRGQRPPVPERAGAGGLAAPSRTPSSTDRDPTGREGRAPERTVPTKTAWADVEASPPLPPVRETSKPEPRPRPDPVAGGPPAPPAGGEPGLDGSQPSPVDPRPTGFRVLDVRAADPEPAGPASRPAPPPTPMMPTTRPQVSPVSDDAQTDDGDDAGIVERLRARFDRSSSEEPADETPEPEPETNGSDGGFVSSVRSRFGFGSDDEDEDTEEPEDTDAAEETDETEVEQTVEPEVEAAKAQTGPSPDESGLMESLRERIGPEREDTSDDDREPRTDPGSVSGPVAYSAADGTQPEAAAPAPPAGGDRVPATPEPLEAESNPGHEAPASPEQPSKAPAPPAGGNPVPGHPDLGGEPAHRPDPGPEFEDVDVPEPDVLHEQVDGVLDRYDRSNSEGSR